MDENKGPSDNVENEVRRSETVIVSAGKNSCSSDGGRNETLKSLLEKKEKDNLGQLDMPQVASTADSDAKREQPVIVPTETVTHVLTYGEFYLFFFFFSGLFRLSYFFFLNLNKL